MLWSERLYTDFVKPLGSGVGEPDYCLQASVALMQDAASKLYMNALSDDEMDARKTQVLLLNYYYCYCHYETKPVEREECGYSSTLAPYCRIYSP